MLRELYAISIVNVHFLDVDIGNMGNPNVNMHVPISLAKLGLTILPLIVMICVVQYILHTRKRVGVGPVMS